MSETSCANCGDSGSESGLYTGDDGRKFCCNACEAALCRMERAAPDLYEALDMMVQVFGGVGETDSPTVHRAIAALAKARWEETR